jgi:CHASE2 domain-containing sensor protein
MRVRYVPPGVTIPKVSLLRLLDDPSLAAQFAGKAVFVGVTAETLVRDRLFTPVRLRAQHHRNRDQRQRL